MEHVTMTIHGMTCGGCVASVTRVLKALSGISEVAVDLESGSARVAFDPGVVNPEMMAAAVEDAGYDVVA